MQPTLVQAANAMLGEAPSWHAPGQSLFWVDVLRPAVFRYEPARGQTGAWRCPDLVASAVPTDRGRLLVACGKRFMLLDPASGAMGLLAEVEADRPDNRINEAKVDPRGRIFAGTTRRRSSKAEGALYRLESGGRLTTLADGFVCVNGMGWSPDRRTMYVTDSPIRTIWAYAYDDATGSLGGRSAFARLNDDDGMPDGLTVDSEGGVWSAIWGGGRVVRYAPSGEVLGVVDMPVARPSSCAFGGRDLSTLYVTTACTDLPAEQWIAGPLAGGLFAVAAGVAGVADPLFIE